MLIREIYQDRKGEWRWRVTRGGNIVATCHEGYTRKADAKRAWKRFSDAMRAGRWMQAEPFIQATRKAPKRKGSRVT